jgi:manganese/zinc/iron transport system substrate-binding protein
MLARRRIRHPGWLASLFWLAVLLPLAAAGCGPAAGGLPADFTQRPIRAVATTGMITDIVANVGGEQVEVNGLMGAGVDPHLYKPSERDVIALAGADVIFYNGLHLEAQMARVFEKMQEGGGYSRVRTVAVTDGIDRARLSAPPEFEGNYDPHVWFDVTMWMQAAETVRDALVGMDPAHAGEYQARAAAYLEQLQGLHEYVQAQAARVPADQRVLITAHDAFNYFGQAYGFQVRGLQGISTAAEAGTGDVQDLVDFIVENRIPAMFVESSVPARTIEAVQAAVRARGFDVQIGGELFSDAMGSPGTPEGTYTGMVVHNIDTIVKALLQE